MMQERRKMLIRKTLGHDFNAIMDVEKAAFGHEKEADLVAELLADPSAEPVLSLLAFHNNSAVGHILFTRVRFAGQNGPQPLMHILAPLAVKPEYQKQGIGGMLIAEGLKILRENGSELVFVLGHKEYYPRHGFITDAGGLGFSAPYPIPAEHAGYWMVQPLTPKGLEIAKGRILCADTLQKPEHWRE
ncbi:N-acetyltransferase [Desulfovibrio sp. OttesenSCG-928-O18]|nr:N-acetyltransferase [Desulfovibrio sp. OttesenSCG-928-O18]